MAGDAVAGNRIVAMNLCVDELVFAPKCKIPPIEISSARFADFQAFATRWTAFIALEFLSTWRLMKSK